MKRSLKMTTILFALVLMISAPTMAFTENVNRGGGGKSYPHNQ